MADKKKSGIFAAVGAATGLGNAFRFPALCVSYGAAFILAYAVALCAVCFPLLCAELGFGRRAATGKRAEIWRAVMRAAAVNSAVIALYYAVIAAKLGSASVSFAVFGNAGCTYGAAAFGALAAVIICAFILLKRGAKALSYSGKASVILSLAAFACLAAAGVFRGGIFSSFSLSALCGGAIWSDALGQALLALSLAAGVMPSFAKTLPQSFSVPRTAFKIIAANFAGCMLAMCATLPFVSVFPSTVGVNCALEVYPQVIFALFKNAWSARLVGAALFLVLTLVAVHSLCSLALPLVSAARIKFAFAPLAFCLSAAALYPLFSTHNLQILSSCDRMACSVNAVAIAFAECLFFASRRHIKGVNALFIRFLCPAACGFLAVFSLCSARFSCFSPLASACAFIFAAAVIACGLFPLLTFFVKRFKIYPQSVKGGSKKEKL